jgi:predicted SprT family Zn-dependent metalloprotease
MSKMTDKKLQKEFHDLNERFFNGKLGCEARFKKIRTDGVFSMITQRITIDSRLQNSQSLTRLVLLHEMAHAYMTLHGYRGYREDGGHGMLFQVELDRLYRAGAYDGLL